MCKNSTRKVLWEDVAKVDMQPIFVKTDLELASQESGVSIELTVIHITEPEDYRIFDHLKSGNMTGALDMIEEHKGINALDEWGQSALMMAVRMKKLEIVAALLNTRMPKVNVNVAKSVSVYAFLTSCWSCWDVLFSRFC